MKFHGRKATVWGLGHFGGGVAAARWLAQQGALVTVTDSADAAVLADSLTQLNDIPLAGIHLGGHREEDFWTADLVVVNPAISPKNPWLQIARQSGVPLRTEIELFMQACPGNILGVTGSNGKSTTAAMTAAILKAAGHSVFLGGNIGGSLLEHLPQMQKEDWVVLELSSFQLWHMSQEVRMPRVAVATGCTPNHLDWHDNFQHYISAKQRLFLEPSPSDTAVLNPYDSETAAWSPLVKGRLATVPSLAELPLLPVPGEHNRIDAACAAAAALAAGCDFNAVRRGLESYRALPQRLEWVAELNGLHFYNDSTATTPESTLAALHALPMPLWLMAGGKNKGFDFDALAEAIVHRTQGAAFFGQCRDELLHATQNKSPQFHAVSFETMAEALRWCQEHAKPGDAVLLSPACASTDQFQNFRQRGQRFVELVQGT